MRATQVTLTDCAVGRRLGFASLVTQTINTIDQTVSRGNVMTNIIFRFEFSVYARILLRKLKHNFCIITRVQRNGIRS